jgi:hypothetical protein
LARPPFALTVAAEEEVEAEAEVEVVAAAAVTPRPQSRPIATALVVWGNSDARTRQTRRTQVKTAVRAGVM